MHICNVEQSRFQCHVHARFDSIRRRVVDAMASSEAQALQKRTARILGCCAHPTVAIGADGTPRIAARRCRDRVCPLCSAQKADEYSKALTVMVRTWSSCRFVTLTQKSRKETLALALMRLSASLKQLRRRRWFLDRVDGGVIAIEATFNTETLQWHAHAHLIVSGEFLPQDELSREWLSTTGDSSIVHVRACHDRRDAAKYVSKYLSKGCDAETWSDAAICEFALAVSRHRMTYAFGTARKLSIAKIRSELRPPAKEQMVPPHYVDCLARLGNQTARRAANTLWRCMPKLMNALDIWRASLADDQSPVTPTELRELRLDLLHLRRGLESHRTVGEREPCAAPTPPRTPDAALFDLQPAASRPRTY